jgi:predicted transcriptional regulator
MTTQFSVRLPLEQKEFLDSLAEATNSTRNHVISSAVAKMMDNYQFVLNKIEQGDADYEAGLIVTMDEAELRIQTIIDQAHKRKVK